MSNSDDDLDTFSLPLSCKPGTDLMSRFLLNDQHVINLIVRSLLGDHIPDNVYNIGQSDWVDTEDVFIVYVSKNENDDRFTPVIVSIQNEVCWASMSETLRHCTLVYEKNELLPTVLIISIKDYSSLDYKERFSVDEDSFLARVKSDFWAQHCFVFFPDSIGTVIKLRVLI